MKEAKPSLSELIKSLPRIKEESRALEYKLKCGKYILGPYELKTLRKFFTQSSRLPKFDRILVRNANDKDFVPILLHPHFQRRSPQYECKKDIDTKAEVYILHLGQKSGPYTFEEVQGYITEATVLPVDEVSVDGGKTWLNIFEVKQFDRRDWKSQGLPDLPEWDVFKESYEEITDQFSIAETTNIEVLNEISMQTKDATPIVHLEIEQKWDFSIVDFFNRNKKNLLYGSSAVLSIIGIVLGLSGKPSNQAQRTPASVKKRKKSTVKRNSRKNPIKYKTKNQNRRNENDGKIIVEDHLSKIRPNNGDRPNWAEKGPSGIDTPPYDVKQEEEDKYYEEEAETAQTEHFEEPDQKEERTPSSDDEIIDENDEESIGPENPNDGPYDDGEIE